MLHLAFLLDRKLIFYLPVRLESYYWQNSQISVCVYVARQLRTLQQYMVI